ncbi:PTS glucose transporter subunit IIA [Alteromonas confluentis]|uniref:PTS system glucose-specific EIIA component n=1 Tax=Alteromonas confluentis TaxID=1656094 RepID=A0A1E7ZFU9_9ALTE|nr:PTS glucose transporter subunit IIA [Alteromonas confluentis]OFC72350.1 hypothetical protein BFC18_03600 [Alteromonas confluentis]
MTHGFSTTAPQQYQREFVVNSPVNGSRIDLGALNLPLHKAGMWGATMAFRYSGHTVFAPADCLIESIPESGYELKVKTGYGLKLWINLLPHPHHLMGEKCERLVKRGQKVKAGTPLMHLQPQWLKQQGFEPTGVICVRNGDKCKAVVASHLQQFVAAEDPLIHIYI